MHKALYPGSFDPITNGHIDILKRASQLFDHVRVAIAENSAKKSLFSVEERKVLIEKVLKEECIENVSLGSFSTLTVEYAKNEGFDVMIRGLRAISDFDFEFQMVLTNRQMAEEVETVFLMPSQDHFYLSSHIVKEIVALHGSVDKFVPDFVVEALEKKLVRT